MLSPMRVWQLVLLLLILLSTTRNAVSNAACISLITNNGNTKISATTSAVGPGYPVVNGNDVWCASIVNEEQHLKVDLGFNLQLDRVLVQGKRNTNRSVSQYSLEISTDNVNFNEVKQTFFGPLYNGDLVVTSVLTTPVQARWVIFNPEEPMKPNHNYLCMRIDIQSCQNVPTPIDGGLSEWSPWSQCQCNQIRSRTRTCTNPVPAFGGKDCLGHKGEDQICSRQCPIDGMWGAWTGWSACSASCGNGERYRIRLCNNPSPAHGGAYCVGSAIDTAACLNQICTTTPPPTTTQLPETTTSPPTTKPPDTTTSPPTTKPPDTTTSPPTTKPPDTTTSPPTTKPPDTTTSPNTTPSPDTTTAAPVTTAPPDTTTPPAPTTVPTPTTGVPGNNISYIDIVFAISATSNNSAQRGRRQRDVGQLSTNYAAMTDTIKQFIDEYGGADRVHASILVFGDQVTRVVNFNHTFPPNANQLKAAIDAQPALSGGPVLTKALQETFSVFNETMSRPNAKKVLVVMIDKNSDANKTALDTAVRPLEDSDVLVISVTVGAVNRSELLVVSPNPLDVISVNGSVDRLKLSENIMARILRKIPEIDVGFAITATSIQSRVIYDVLLQSSNEIKDRYREYDIRFSIVIYGSKNTTKLRDFSSNLDTHEGLIATVNGLPESPPGISLQDKLSEAERLFRSGGRQFSKKVFVVLTDTENDNEIIAAGDSLRRHGVVLLSVNITGGQLVSVTIHHIDYLDTPTITTVRPVVIAESIIYKALQVNIPEIDLTFALSATSAEADITYRLMQASVTNIIEQYGIGRIRYSVIVFGSVVARAVDFDDSIPDKNILLREVLHQGKLQGPPDLASALEDVNRVYQSRAVRPNARRILVVIMDNATVSSREDLTKAVYTLVNNSVFIMGVGIGNSINPTDLAIITREVRHTIIVGTNKSHTELSEEIVDIILLAIRTAGFSLWGPWDACSQTCRSFGVAGTQTRSRFCINPKLGCDGPTVETRECNGQNCQVCGERVLPGNDSYQASSELQPARYAKLNTSNPRESDVAWCREASDVDGYLQLDLGEKVVVDRVATKGQERSNAQRWVTTYFISLSDDGLTYSNYEEEGQRKVFNGSTDATTVVFNDINTTAVKFVRFHPLSFHVQACMQASVFGCTAQIGPDDGRLIVDDKAGKGILIALWILAGILTFLLLMACCYYCCWHVCCGRGKKRKGITHRYLIEDDTDKRWILMPTGMAKPVAENEIQEVVVEIGEEKAKPSGVIQFGIEAEETKGSHVTAETVHSELPVYSDEVATINSNASSLEMGSKEPRYGSVRKRIKSESSKGSTRNKGTKGSGFGNGGFERSSYEWLADPFELPQVNNGKKGVTRSHSLDELAIVDYDMFEERRGSAQSAEMGPDGYMRMKETSRESVNMPSGGLKQPQETQQFNGMKEQELVFMAENGGQNVHILEKWINADGEEERQSSAANEPVYSEVGSQISKDDPIYSEVGSQISKDESIYSEVGSQISKD